MRRIQADLKVCATAVLTCVALAVVPAPTQSPSRDGQAPRAMWVWDADPLFADGPDRRALLAFCRSENIGTLWVQAKDLDAHAADWRSLIADAHRQGVRLEALDGAPHYALKEYHDAPLGLVDALIAFNNASRPEERFDGIHFDNEPYSLPGWSEPDERKQILEEYLALNAEAARRVHERSSMVIGVDIPFWWPDEAHRVIDLVDNVGIMDYRNTAEGSDGLIAHARALLTYAERPSTSLRAGRQTKIYVGVETSFSEPRAFWFAAGRPARDFRRMVGRAGRDFPSTIGGFPTKAVFGGGVVHVGLRVPDPPADDKRLREAMREVVKAFGAASRQELASGAERTVADTVRELRRDPEWTDEYVRTIPGPDGQSLSPGFQATAIMLPKLTFAVTSIDEMRRELDRAERDFRRYSRYAGIAIHHYESYRELLSQKRRSSVVLRVPRSGTRGSS